MADVPWTLMLVAPRRLAELATPLGGSQPTSSGRCRGASEQLPAILSNASEQLASHTMHIKREIRGWPQGASYRPAAGDDFPEKDTEAADT